MVDFNTYSKKFEAILNASPPPPPYDNAEYFNYLKLNYSRQNRWLKKAEINEDLIQVINLIQQKQEWIVITEPWCGDAAHTIPFIYLATKHSSMIELKFSWRDSAPFLIENYLTNGSKSVPKLIVRDKKNNDLFTWGPRPVACQQLYEKLKQENADFETVKVQLQNWYNTDKGKSFQKELLLKLSDFTSV